MALLGFNPGGWRSVKILPNAGFFVPNQAPGVSITLADNIFGTGTFVNREADGISCRKMRPTQQQNSRGGEILAMPTAGIKQEPAQRSFVRSHVPAGSLPGAVSKPAQKERVQRAHRLFHSLLLKVQLRNDLVQRGPFFLRHAQIVSIRGRIKGWAWPIVGIEYYEIR